MSARRLITIEEETRENAIAVGVQTGRARRADTEEYLTELSLLADTAGATVVRTFIQERQHIDRAYYIGKGKVEEIKNSLEESPEVSLIIFDDDLSPVQARNLEDALERKIIDRSGLILDIFSKRAKSKEAKTQVEVALLEYLLPRLTRRWTHLSKQYGGVGTRGPGEQQIEIDRRTIRKRISILRDRLREISKERSVQRSRREGMPRIALVGYTNAGKSTLLNALTNAEAFVEDRLFATLDSTVRSMWFGEGKRALLTDTVGFIRKLPPQLLASFRSTLDETIEASLLLHVVDCSHPRCEEHITVVRETLQELGAAEKPVLYVFNKIDRIADRSILTKFGSQYHPAVFCSASRGVNLTGLREAIRPMLWDED